MKFTIFQSDKDTLARLGEIATPHGTIQTPAFMPVATAGAIKTQNMEEVKAVGAEIILGNTYHLHLRPGEEHIAKRGGYAKWIGWDGPILTDSGGYQAYSLGTTRAQSAKTTDEGVRFFSHIDGSKHEFTPESVLAIQDKLGSDIAMVLDDCPPIEASKKRVTVAVERTTGWAKQSIEYWQKEQMGSNGRALFGIVQGGLFEDLRLRSLEQIQSLPFDGIAIGGVAIASEGKDKINKAVEYVSAALDRKRPHYLMGVGYPDDLIRMVAQGMDMFDCVLPTRLARHGEFWMTENYQRQSIRASRFVSDNQPLDTECSCKMCQLYSREYIRHLYMSKETLAGRILTYHNLAIYLTLMSEIRQSIKEENFFRKYKNYL